MALPDRETVVSWIGSRVVDPDGAELGTVARLYADDATGTPEWLTVDDEPGGAGLFLPLLDATSQGGEVRVAVRREAVERAPRLGAVDAGLRSEEEVQLYEHYGISYSRSESDTVLPDPGASVGSAGGTGTGGGQPATTSALPPPTRLRRIDMQSVAPPVHSELDRAPEPAPAPVSELPPPVAYPSRTEPAATAPAWKRLLPMVLGAAGVAAAAVGIVLVARRRREPAYRRTARTFGSRAGSAAGLGLGLSDRAAAKLGGALNRTGETESAGTVTARVRKPKKTSALRSAVAKAAVAKAVASRSASSKAAAAKSASADRTSDAADKAQAAVGGLRGALLRAGSAAAKAGAAAGSSAGGLGARVGSATADTGKSASKLAGRAGKAVKPPKRSRFGRKRSVSVPSRSRGIGGTISKVGSGTLSATAGKFRPSKRRKLSKAAGGAASSVSAAPKAVANSTSEITNSVVHTWRKTMARLSLLVGFAAGYVLGARAGTERYEQIKTTAQGLTQRPEVQQLKTKATEAVQSGSAGSSLKGLAAKVKSKSGSSGATPGTYETPAYDAVPPTTTYASETAFADDAPVLTPDPLLDDTTTVDPLGTGTTSDLGYGETGTGTGETYRDRL